MHGLFTGALLPPPLLAADAARHPVEVDLPDRPWRTAGYGLGLMMDIASPHGLCIGHSGQGPDSVAAAYHFPDLDPPLTVAAFAPTDDQGIAERAVLEEAARLRCGGRVPASTRLSKRRAADTLPRNQKMRMGGDDMMRDRLTRSLGSLLVACATLTLPAAAGAQADYPDKPIRLIVPQAPGSATDTRGAHPCRRARAGSSARHIIVENKPGAAFTIGLDMVAKSAPDGYTLGIGPIGALAISPQHGGEAALQHRKGFPADRADRARASAARGVADVQHQVGARN